MTAPDPDRSTEAGFRVEPEYRSATGAPEYVPSTDTRSLLPSAETTQRVVSAAELDDVFDDPDHGEPGRDRMAIHWVWEALLLIGCVAVAFLVAGHDSNLLAGASLRSLLLTTTVTGTLAVAAGISLRAGAVNLAVGPIMVASGLYFADHVQSGFVNATVISLLLALGAGLAIGLVVVILQVPSWVVSLAVFLGLQTLTAHLPVDVQVAKDYHAAHYAYYWFGAFALVAIVGASFGTVRSIRRAV